MTDPSTFTSEHRAWQWELVLKYEDGTLPASDWNESTLTIVATWYSQHLPPDQARSRYEQHYHRNRHRLSNRLDSASVDTTAIAAVDAVWESVLAKALEGKE